LWVSGIAEGRFTDGDKAPRGAFPLGYNGPGGQRGIAISGTHLLNENTIIVLDQPDV
jgi:hypothetical protein